MIFIILTAIIAMIAGFGLSLLIIGSKLKDPTCYGSLHYDKSTGELYLSISDESILNLNDDTPVTLKFRRV